MQHARDINKLSDGHGTQLDPVFAALYEMVIASPANNTSLYEFLAQEATLEQITHFIRWDGEEPHYYLYLQQWLERVPSNVHGYLKEHIDIEINEEHSRHFGEMLAHLNSLVLSPTSFDREKIARLNYTFSPSAAKDQDYGFFVGGFFATEIMHAKRAGQLMQGLLRNGVHKDRLTYLQIHFEADGDHGREIGDMMIAPILHHQPEMYTSIKKGVEDRLSRSHDYLTWYEQSQIKGRNQA